MPRLLIVDDERFILEGLTALFEQSETMELEVHQALDGEEALEKAGLLRMDIVLTDIQMPGINGIRLQQEIAKQWPRCKVIFLTGYDDFQYVQASIRYGALDYVLKAEGDEPIVAAVEKALRQLHEEAAYDRHLDAARNRLKAALPMYRKEYMLELLRGELSTPASRGLRFAELGIPLRSDREVLLLVGRVDRWREKMAPGDKALFVYSINNIVEEYFAARFDTVHLAYGQDRFGWLLQRRIGEADEADEDRTLAEREKLLAYVLGTLEEVQIVCRNSLKLVCSFAVSSGPCRWEELPVHFERLTGLFVQGLGAGSEALLTDRHLLRSGRLRERECVKRIGLLSQYLEQKEPDKFAALYDEILGAIQSEDMSQSQPQPGLALEIFYHLAAIFLSYLNRWELLDEISQTVNLNRLYDLREHRSWAEATAFFRKLAQTLFELRTDENEREMDEVVRTIHEYIDAHLEGDLTLNQLSELVHLTPYYLSRLYKQKTGDNLSDRIAAARMTKANELLGGTQLKIQSIALQVGYESASYFARLYRKTTGMTPQEFRDSVKR